MTGTSNHYLPLVAHFFSPALRRAPRPLRSGRLRSAAKLIAAFSLEVSGGVTKGFSGAGAGSSPSAGGKSWIDQLLFIEQNY